MLSDGKKVDEKVQGLVTQTNVRQLTRKENVVVSQQNSPEYTTGWECFVEGKGEPRIVLSL
jgi:hypothetical protein